MGCFHRFLGKRVPAGIIGGSTGHLLIKGKVQVIDGCGLFEDLYRGVRNFAANAVTRDNNDLFSLGMLLYIGNEPTGRGNALDEVRQGRRLEGVACGLIGNGTRADIDA